MEEKTSSLIQTIKQNISQVIIGHSHTVDLLLTALLLLLPSLLGMAATRINYDILTYLPPELDSMIGEAALENAVRHLESIADEVVSAAIEICPARPCSMLAS